MIPLVLFALSGCLAPNAASDRIVAGDLIPVWPDMAALPADTVIGFAPTPGVQRVLRAAELRRVADRFHLLSAPDVDICVERPSAPLDEARLLAAMRRTLPSARIEVMDFVRAAVPDGIVEFPRTGLRTSLGGTSWSGWVLYAGNRRFPIWAKVKVTASTTRVLAVEDLKAGTALEVRHLRQETRDEVPGPETFATSIESAAGRTLRRPVHAGDVIRLQWLEIPKDVSRGDSVRVEVQSGAAHLEFEGQAQSSGSAGQTIPVLNPLTKRRFPARVEGKGRVSVGKGDS